VGSVGAARDLLLDSREVGNEKVEVDTCISFELDSSSETSSGSAGNTARAMLSMCFATWEI
jgi:hypothetical protein